MPSKIVVIIQNQNARILSRALPVKIGRRQSADAPAHNNQIVRFSRLDRRACSIPAFSVAQLMSVGEGAIVIPAHSGQRRWIVARRLFRSPLLTKEGSKHRIAGHQSARADRHTIQKIPSRNRATHAQPSIFPLTHAMRPVPCNPTSFSIHEKLLRPRTDESNIRPPKYTRRIGCRLPFPVAFTSRLFSCSQPLHFSVSRSSARCKRNPTHRSNKSPRTSPTSSSITTRLNGVTPT